MASENPPNAYSWALPGRTGVYTRNGGADGPNAGRYDGLNSWNDTLSIDNMARTVIELIDNIN